MKQYIFTETHKQSRGGLMVSFPLWDKEMFIKHVTKLSKKEYGSIFRFGAIGGYMNLLKDMSLETFEEVFPENPFCVEHITLFFRKEISLKYGEHKAKSELKFLPKKEIIAGKSYIDHNGDEWVYIGEVEQTIDKMAYYDSWNSRKKDYTPEVKQGYGFLFVRDLSYGNHADRVTVLKTMKKFVSKVEVEQKLFQVPESKELKYESGASKSGYRWHERIVTLKFL